jgi:sulfate transport system ATP-binding protein
MQIRFEGVEKRFDRYPALRGVDLDIGSGELIALLGPSGSGKTTLLRAMAGLESVDRGRILFGERDATTLSVQQRRVGFVFQNYALFRHMSVLENIAFGLNCRPRRERPPRAEIERRALDLLAKVQLAELRDRLPEQLSGGQRQRVALARAMAIDPTVLLLDEPFGALDAKVRVELRRWLREIHDATGYTTVFVTHDQEEALELADRVVVLNQGRIEQIGTPEEIYARPASAFVFDFVGRSNRLLGRVEGGAFVHAGFAHALAADERPADGPAQLFVRPHDLRLAAVDAGLAANVRHIRHRGERTTLELALHDAGTPIELDLGHAGDGAVPAVGSVVGVQFRQARVFALAE